MTQSEQQTYAHERVRMPRAVFGDHLLRRFDKDDASAYYTLVLQEAQLRKQDKIAEADKLFQIRSVTNLSSFRISIGLTVLCVGVGVGVGVGGVGVDVGADVGVCALVWLVRRVSVQQERFLRFLQDCQACKWRSSRFVRKYYYHKELRPADSR